MQRLAAESTVLEDEARAAGCQAAGAAREASHARKNAAKLREHLGRVEAAYEGLHRKLEDYTADKLALEARDPLHSFA